MKGRGACVSLLQYTALQEKLWHRESYIEGMSETQRNAAIGDDPDSTSSWPYSNANATQVVRIAREESFLAWVGRREKLIRIAAEVDKALANAYKEMLADQQLSPETNQVHRRMAEDIAQELQPGVTVLAGRGRMKRSGDLESILNDMDAREIECITMGNGSRHSSAGKYPEIFIQMGHDGPNLIFIDRNIVQLKVTGPDRQWVGGVFDLLASEIRKDVPWWAVIRSTFASVLFAVLLVGGGVPLLMAVAPEQPGQDPATRLILNIASAVMLIFMSTLLIRPALRRIFPAVEVLEAGASARGRQVLAVAVGVLTFAMGAAGVVLGFIAL